MKGIEFGTPIECRIHAERACLCVATPCPCHCHRVTTRDLLHFVGCLCETCSATYEREAWDPRMGAK